MGRERDWLRARGQHARFVIDAGEAPVFADGHRSERFRVGVDAEFEFHEVAVGFRQLVEQVAVLCLEAVHFRDECLVEFLLAGVGRGSWRGGFAGEARRSL